LKDKEATKKNQFGLTNKYGELLEIKVVEFISLNDEIKTYNLSEIENSNNYFVIGFLIHNESEN
jgi:hypothetical protein